jgi:glycosyltransferase involved in cell wall biosynthesis
MLVSLIIPAYIRDLNNLGYLEEAIKSALDQTYENIEILVVDDGSPLSQEVKTLVLRYGSPKLRYISKQNGGVADALNLAISEMKGDYFTWLSHDDLYLPAKVEVQLNAALGSPKNTIFYCDVEHIDSTGKHLFFEYTKDLRPEQCRVYFAQHGANNANAHLIPRECFDAVGRFNVKLRTTQDNDMWFRLSKHFPFQRVPAVLIKYRHHSTQDSQSEGFIEECNQLCISFFTQIELSQIKKFSGKTPARYYAECACVCINRQLHKAQKIALKLAIRQLILHPFREYKNTNLILGIFKNTYHKHS